MRLRWLLSIAAVAPLTTAVTQEPQSSPARKRACDDPAFRLFDFWSGQWEVRDRSGKVVGTNTVSIEQNGCVLIERWQARAGGSGISMNYYDPQAKRWRQNWVSPGVVLQMTGDFANGAMVLEGPLQNLAQQHVTLLRGEWTQLPDGRLRQLFTESADGGKTWNEWFDGYYTRVAK
jgi:hypothetical protein